MTIAIDDDLPQAVQAMIDRQRCDAVARQR
jgi:hypothetical protein